MSALEEGAEARLRTLQAVESALRAEVTAAQADLAEVSARVRAPPTSGLSGPEKEYELARCRVREINSKTIAQLRETEYLLEMQLEETRQRIKKRKNEDHDLKALVEELQKDSDSEEARNLVSAISTEGNNASAPPTISQTAADENAKLQRIAKVFLNNHFNVPGDVGFWKRFLRMPESVTLAGADDAANVVNSLLASGVCVEPNEDEEDDLPPVGAKRFMIVQ
mmetsp:Transcript_17375/g.34127  ORF Transcript_17375/g.34127 Transcript_17375/m.34127 type:complete len:224 (+) Transcript_17375:53-724(+)